MFAPPGDSTWIGDRTGQLRLCHSSRVVLGLRPDAALRYASPPERRDLERLIEEAGVAVSDRCPPIAMIAGEIAPDETVLAACTRLAALPFARYVEPEWLGEGGYTPSDTWFREEWHLQNAGGPSVRAVEAWDITRGSESVIVAAIDSGIDLSSPEFKGRLLTGYDFVWNDDVPEAEHPHGIYSTGILAANADNAFGVAGIDQVVRSGPEGLSGPAVTIDFPAPGAAAANRQALLRAAAVEPGGRWALVVENGVDAEIDRACLWTVDLAAISPAAGAPPVSPIPHPLAARGLFQDAVLFIPRAAGLGPEGDAPLRGQGEEARALLCGRDRIAIVEGAPRGGFRETAALPLPGLFADPRLAASETGRCVLIAGADARRERGSLIAIDPAGPAILRLWPLPGPADLLVVE